MAKLVILKVEQGDFQQGFDLTLRIGNESKSPTSEISSKLPANLSIVKNYQRWQSDFLELGRLRGRRGESKAIDPKKIWAQCQQSAQDFLEDFQAWLKSPDEKLQNLREKLCQQLGEPKEVIRIIIQTNQPLLKKFPWHQWDLLAKTYTRTEVALCSSEYEKPNLMLTTHKMAVGILAILGDSEGIDVESDRQFLKNLKGNGAAPTFLVEPKRAEISNNLWEQNWDILFFAGHSASKNNQGQIFINATESLTIEDLKFGLSKAINRGLQLAILNSCDGLKLAEDLAELNIPQVIIMREPVPDKVAQTFLRFFLQAFTSGESLYIAVRHARQRLDENHLDDEFPGATWLPIIYQNPSVSPPTWEQLKTPEPAIAHKKSNQSGNGYRGSEFNEKPGSSRKRLSGIENTNDYSEGLSNVQFLLTHFLPNLIAGIGGFSLMVVLLINTKIIDLIGKIFSYLSPTQVVLIIASMIVLTFLIAIIGIYAWLATKRGIQFRYVVVFMILIFTIFAFIMTGIHTFMQNGALDGGETKNHEENPPPPNDWYSKAIIALDKNNKFIALEYLNKGLEKTPPNAPKPMNLLAFKIKVLLLIGGRDNQTEAKNIADQNNGYSSVFDEWVECLKTEKLFFSIITTKTELEAKCRSPAYQDLKMVKNDNIFPSFIIQLLKGIL